MPPRTPPTLRSLRRDKALLFWLHRITRLSQELTDRVVTDPTQEQNADYLHLQQEMLLRIQVAQDAVQRQGGKEEHAVHLVRTLLVEITEQTTPDERRALMSVAHALSE